MLAELPTSMEDGEAEAQAADSAADKDEAGPSSQPLEGPAPSDGTSAPAAAGAPAELVLANESFLADHQKQLAAASAEAVPAAGKQAKPVSALKAAEKVRALEQRKEAERAEKRRQMQLAKEARKAATTMAAKAGTATIVWSRSRAAIAYCFHGVLNVVCVVFLLQSV